MYKRGKNTANIGNFIYNQGTSYFKTYGDAIKYYNASYLEFNQTISTTDKILYSFFADKHTFFMVTQEESTTQISIHSYKYNKFSKNVTYRGSCNLTTANQTTQLKIYSMNRFGDSKIFYIFARETGADIDEWINIEYHGYTNKVTYTYRINKTSQEVDYNIGEAIPSSNLDDWKYKYIVQGLQDPHFEQGLQKIHLRVSIIERNNPTKIFKSKVFEIDYQEQINSLKFQLVGLGYFYTPDDMKRETNYRKQYSAILVKKTEDDHNNLQLIVNQINLQYNDDLGRIQVSLITKPTPKPVDLGVSDCNITLIGQITRGQVGALCR